MLRQRKILKVNQLFHHERFAISNYRNVPAYHDHVDAVRVLQLSCMVSDSLAEWSALRPSVQRVTGSIPGRVGDFNLDWLIPMPRGLGVCDVLSIRNQPR